MVTMDLELALGRIDGFLHSIAGRDLISTDEVADLLLDVRNDITRTVTEDA